MLTDLLNKSYKVKEVFPVISVGNHVTWEVNSRRKGGHKPFMATGVVTDIYTTTFGGSQRKQAARVRPYGTYADIFPGRSSTTVAYGKLKGM